MDQAASNPFLEVTSDGIFKFSIAPPHLKRPISAYKMGAFFEKKVCPSSLIFWYVIEEGMSDFTVEEHFEVLGVAGRYGQHMT